MRRFACVLAGVLAAYTVLSAPAPEPFRTGWDQPVDPDHDCKFVHKGSTLSLELPGTDHELAPKRGRFNAPRLLRDIEGDFVMQVRVSGSFCPSVKSSVEGVDSSVAAGLVLIPADKNCIRLEYGAYRKKGERCTGANYRMRGDRIFNVEKWGWMPWEEKIRDAKEEHMYLRLERRGEFIYHFISPDGEKWIDDFNVGPFENLPRKIKAGLAAHSTSTEPFKATFDQFKLIQGQKKKP